MRKRWRWLVLAVGGLALLGGAGWLGYQQRLAQAVAQVAAPPTVAVSRGPVVQSVTAPGQVVDVGVLIVAAPVGGRVAALALQPGDVFTQGQVLAQLGDRQSYQSALDAARLQMLQAQQTLDQLQAGAGQAAAQAQQQLAQDQKDLQTAQRALAGLSRPDVTAYQQQVAAAQTALTTAQENAQITALGALSSTLHSARQSLVTATNIYHDALSAQSRCPGCPRVFAPAAGQWVALAEAHAQMDAAANAVTVLELQLAQAQRADSAAVQAAQQQLATAQTRLMQARNQTPAPADLALAQANLALAQARLAAAQQARQRLRSGPDPDSLAVDEAAVTNAQDALTTAQTNLAGLEVRAPFAGVVLAVSAAPGQSVAAGTPLLSVTRPGALVLQATVVEQDYPLVAAGQAAEVFFDALSGVSVTGRVARVVPQSSPGTQVIYPLVIELDQLPDHLAAGMTADASIVIARRDSVLRLPRAVAHVRADGTAEVQVWAGGQAASRRITLGLRGDSFVEVLSGLQAGERVLTQ